MENAPEKPDKLTAVEITGIDINDLPKMFPEFEMMTAPIHWIYRKQRSDGSWLMFPEFDAPAADDPDYYPPDYEDSQENS